MEVGGGSEEDIFAERVLNGMNPTLISIVDREPHLRGDGKKRKLRFCLFSFYGFFCAFFCVCCVFPWARLNKSSDLENFQARKFF